MPHGHLDATACAHFLRHMTVLRAWLVEPPLTPPALRKAAAGKSIVVIRCERGGAQQRLPSQCRTRHSSIALHAK